MIKTESYCHHNEKLGIICKMFFFYSIPPPMALCGFNKMKVDIKTQRDWSGEVHYYNPKNFKNVQSEGQTLI